jgi:threonine dehydrogenase-like Zn-dependent dehydrogenase
MFSVAVLEPGRVEIVEIPKPEPGSYDAVVKTEVSYLCNATDRKIIGGHFPGIDTYPVLLGHESVGTVQSVGEKVRTFRPGDRVVGGLLFTPTDAKYGSAWGGFSEYTVVKDHLAMVEDELADPHHGWDEIYKMQRVVPKTIPFEAAGLLCTWREVYGGFGDFGLHPGDDVLIFGGGPVGLTFVKFAKLLGLGYVGCVDPHPEKRTKAEVLGADDTFAPDDPRIPKLKALRGKPFDAVIDAVGREAIIRAALPMVKMAGSICVYGVIEKPTIEVDLSQGPYNFNMLIHQWPTRDRETAATEPICEWIQAGKLDPTDFISAEFPIEKVTSAIELLNSRVAIKILLRY